MIADGEGALTVIVSESLVLESWSLAAAEEEEDEPTSLIAVQCFTLVCKLLSFGDQSSS